MIKFKNNDVLLMPIEELNNGATFIENNSVLIVADEYDGSMRLVVDLNTGTIRRFAKGYKVRVCDVTAEVNM